MMNRRSCTRLLVLFVVLIPIAVTSTPPAPSPWHRFNVSGVVQSRSGGPVRNFTVVLMGQLGGAWEILHSCSVPRAVDWGGTQDIDITNARGSFYLDVWCCSKPDTFAAAVVLPDTMLIGSRVARRSLYYQRYDASYEVGGWGFGCDEEEVTAADGYMYEYLDSLTVPVP